MCWAQTTAASALVFPFGENWLRFATKLTDDDIAAAIQSLQQSLGESSLQGLSFLDAGCGSGLLSLAATRLGARVHSFDIDAKAVECTRELKAHYPPDDAGWTIEKGSVLNQNYLSGVGQFDIVYSWGVLHHTGDMYQALANIITTVGSGGKLLISIYNDHGWRSKYWLFIKRNYNKNGFYRRVIMVSHVPYLFGLRYLVRLLRGRLSPGRGMSVWHDTIDWLGGYPFEVAKPEDVISFFKDHDLALEQLEACSGRNGCNEFLFRRR